MNPKKLALGAASVLAAGAIIGGGAALASADPTLCVGVRLRRIGRQRFGLGHRRPGTPDGRNPHRCHR